MKWFFKCSLWSSLFLVAGMLLSSAWAGDLDSPGSPTDATSAMYSIGAIYHRLDSGAAGAGIGPYANTSASDWGVNMDEWGNLSGYGWSSQAGWINFNPTHSQVNIDPVTGVFSGFAWAENIGWISFQGTSPDYGVKAILDSGVTGWALDY